MAPRRTEGEGMPEAVQGECSWHLRWTETGPPRNDPAYAMRLETRLADTEMSRDGFPT